MKEKSEEHKIAGITLTAVINDMIIFDMLSDFIKPELMREFRTNVNKKGVLIFIPDK